MLRYAPHAREMATASAEKKREDKAKMQRQADENCKRAEQAKAAAYTTAAAVQNKVRCSSDYSRIAPLSLQVKKTVTFGVAAPQQREQSTSMAAATVIVNTSFDEMSLSGLSTTTNASTLPTKDDETTP